MRASDDPARRRGVRRARLDRPALGLPSPLWRGHREAGARGALFVFFGKRRDAIKVLFFDGTGVCLFYKRLDAGTFRIPEAARDGDAAVQIEERALDALLDGIDLAPTTATRRPVTH